MSDIPREAVEALAYELYALASAHDDTDVDSYRAPAEAILRKVEEAWPHAAPGRDIAGTTASSTERSYQTSGYHRLSFGFGPPGVRA